MSALDGVAIVGMAVRAPGAQDLAAFRALARSGAYAGRGFSDAELAGFGVPEALRRHPDFVAATGVLDAFDAFDHGFFGLTPREAELHDPQFRVMLETVWHALEDAGCDPAAAGGPVGVFVGMGTSGYYWNNVLPALRESQAESLLGRAANDKDFLATLISYKLDLRGPSVSVQTACSTSLVAVHLAVQSLLAGECDLAVAGGVAIVLPQDYGGLYASGGITSRDGRCRPFDAAADGTFGGSGAGVVVLRRLEDALAAGDAIYAVIRGSAVNNDGARKAGFTAPSVEGQVAAIGEALDLAGFAPDTVGFVETHGTATGIGDAIELRALRTAFAGAPRGSIALGAIKSSIGHLDTAAGVVGLIRAALAVAGGELPGNPYFERPNPLLELDTSPFTVPTAPAPWHAAGPRRAAVSSFGIGGTNAHVVLEQAPPHAAERTADVAVPAEPEPDVYVVSARSADGLAAAVRAHADALARRGDAPLAPAATASRARRAFAHRAAVAASTCAAAARGLAGPEAFGASVPAGPAVVFAFPGQGAQYAGMARPLYRAFPAFRAAFDACAEAARAGGLARDLRALVFEGDAAALGRTEHTQPALFAVEYATARLWESLGVRPAAMIGHSVGEYVAACLAGVFSPADAVALVVARGRLMQTMAPGAMLAVALDERRVRALLPPELEIAALNAPVQTVVGGPAEAVERFALELAERDIRTTRVATALAFHTRATEPVLDAFEAVLRTVRFAPPARRYVSNLSGGWIEPEQAQSPAYWVAHARGTVRYAQGLATVLRDPRALLLETGPGRTLTELGRRRLRTTLQRAVTSLPTAAESADAHRHFLAACGRLWVAGAPLDLAAATPAYAGPRARLPGYAFECRRAFLPPVFPAAAPPAAAASPATPPAAASPAAPPAAASPVAVTVASSAGAASPTPGTAAVAPALGTGADASAIEATVLTTWRAAFGVAELSPDDDFFALGGNSLTASAVVSRLRDELRLDIPIATLFAAPSVRELSGELVRLAATAPPAAATAPPSVAAASSVVAAASPAVGAASAVAASLRPAAPVPAAGRGVRFGVFYFAQAEGDDADRYGFVLDSVALADRLGFDAAWVPERHFHAFGGIYPNPSTLAAALAARTERIGIRAGSVVAPLHHPARIAEEWAVVDNLSRGRAGVSFATGWHPADFVFAPGSFAERADVTAATIDAVRRLWRGEAVVFDGPDGVAREVRTFPRPVQPELPVWLTTSGSLATCARAGTLGTNLLASLIGATFEQLAERIAAYRAARAAAGHDPATGVVTVMVHAYAGADAASTRAAVYEPLRAYLRSFFAQQRDASVELGDAAAIERQIEFATEKYVGHAALIGTTDHCRTIVERLRACGADEIACLIDFGTPRAETLASLERLGELVAAYRAEPAVVAVGIADAAAVVPAGIDQARLVELELREPSVAGNHVAGGLLIAAAPDRAALERALCRLAGRHESLRSRFRRGPAGIERVVAPDGGVSLTHEDGRASVGLDREALRARLTAFAREPFALEAGPLTRALALRTADDEFALALVMHHAVTDWVASGVLFRELVEAYRAELDPAEPDRAALDAPELDSAARPAAAPHEPGRDFGAFARWEREAEARALFAANAAYFRDVLAGAGEPVTIPPDLPPPARRSYDARRMWFVLDEATASAAAALARQTRCTPYAVFLAAYNALLARLTGRADVVVGTPSANREDPAFAQTVGLLMSMMPLRTRVDASDSFRAAVEAARRTAVGALAHQTVPYRDVIAAIRPAAQLEHLPLFRVRYLYLTWHVPPADAGLRAVALDVDPCSTFYDFTLALWEAPRGYFGRIEYDADRYSPAAMNALLEAFCALAGAAVRDPDRPLGELPLRTGARHALGYAEHIAALQALA